MQCVCHQIQHAACSDVCHTTQFSYPCLTCSNLLPQDNAVNEFDCANNPYYFQT